MIGVVVALAGGAVLVGVGCELVWHAFATERVPLIACLAFAAGVFMVASGWSVLRCAVEVSHER